MIAIAAGIIVDMLFSVWDYIFIAIHLTTP